nr:hypothetical protein [Paenibacillus beijingensis]
MLEIPIRRRSQSGLCALRWDFVAWNRAACEVFGDYNEMSELERNSIWRTFTSSYMKELLDCSRPPFITG